MREKISDSSKVLKGCDFFDFFLAGWVGGGSFIVLKSQ